MKVVIIKYNAGNTQSVLYALERLGVSALVTDDQEQIMAADKVIFPGVGEANSAMNYLNERKLASLIAHLQQPFLGICLGMQLMCLHSEENDTVCLGIFNASVKKFSSQQNGLKIPQIGWNKVTNISEPLFSGILDEPYCYFVHSYYAELCEETAAVSDYGVPFSSALQKGNYYGVQFHPEKSAAEGEKILRNFLSL